MRIASLILSISGSSAASPWARLRDLPDSGVRLVAAG